MTLRAELLKPATLEKALSGFARKMVSSHLQLSGQRYRAGKSNFGLKRRRRRFAIILASGGTKFSMDELIDVAEVFRQMPTRFQRGRIDRQLVFYFSIENDHWTVFVGPQTCDVKPGKAVENADCFLKTSREIFLGTISGQYTPTMTDLIMGKIKTNNPMLLQTFRELFST